MTRHGPLHAQPARSGTSAGHCTNGLGRNRGAGRLRRARHAPGWPARRDGGRHPPAATPRGPRVAAPRTPSRQAAPRRPHRSFRDPGLGAPSSAPSLGIGEPTAAVPCESDPPRLLHGHHRGGIRSGSRARFCPSGTPYFHPTGGRALRGPDPWRVNGRLRCGAEGRGCFCAVIGSYDRSILGWGFALRRPPSTASRVALAWATVWSYGIDHVPVAYRECSLARACALRDCSRTSSMGFSMTWAGGILAPASAPDSALNPCTMP